ncbi:hypothetical protein [Streptomyces sp. C8S0]|uniref:hypothetical protein n=1 Tax=Streptomyces sp. C8S0 TaxID=2585716 RepID=UPI001D03AAA7|nr:hypothetical protein [Streptomyces sp. C8S0]
MGALALAGLPPLSLWATKDAVLAAVLVRDPVLYAVGSAAGAVSAVYSAKALWYVATGRSSEGRGSGRVPPVMLPPLVCRGRGRAGVLVLPGGRDALRSAVGAVGEPVPHAAEAVLSGRSRWSRPG